MDVINFTDARILLKNENENSVFADTRISKHDVKSDWIWIDADLFEISEGTKLSALVVTRSGFHEILCMAQKKENNGSGLRLSIYKHLTGNEQRHESRYNLAAEGSLIVLEGAENVVNSQLSIRISDISSNGIGFLINESVSLKIKDEIEVFFVANGWSMRAIGTVTYVFGPRIGARLRDIEKSHVIKDNNRFSKETKDKIDKALEQLFICAHYVNIAKDTYMEVNCMPHIRHIVGEEKSAKAAFKKILDATVSSSYKDTVAEFFDLSTLNKRLRNKPQISVEFLDVYMGVCRSVFVPVDYDEHDNLHGVLHVAQKLDDELVKLRSNKEAADALNEAMNEGGLPEEGATENPEPSTETADNT